MTPADSAAASRQALEDLRYWATRRDRLAADRADLMAAAWRAGVRNVAELARTADVSRDTAYSDLRSMGIDPRDPEAKGAPPDQEHPRNDPRLYEAMGRTVLAVRDTHLVGPLDRLDYWITIEAGIAIEWQDGAYAHEVADALQRQIQDEDAGGTLRPDHVGFWQYDLDSPETDVAVTVLGKRVQLRSRRPVGYEAATARHFARMRSAAAGQDADS